MEHYSDECPINVGTGEDRSILELAQLIAQVLGFKGRFELDRNRPDGTPRKLLDVSRLGTLGWRPRVDLESGIRITWDWYRRNVSECAAVTAVSM
jgi:GDP-L-fucose synthase